MNIKVLILILPCMFIFSAEENFLLVNGETDKRVLEVGPHIEERVTPCSTFKIALCLMGFDSEVLENETTPTWYYQEGYDDFFESWKNPQTPKSWIKSSCIWYSRLIASELGWEKMQNYLALFEYGNQDMSGGLTNAWVSSSLTISPKEQVDFIKKIANGKLPLSNQAVQMTKSLLYIEELPEGWKLYGKTGWSIQENLQIGWFVGWIEKDNALFPFAYNIRDKQIDIAQRVPRVKQLITESNVMGK